MSDFGDKLALALKQKEEEKLKVKNDMNNWIWKGPKKEVAGIRCQTTTKLVDATPEQLKDWYNHCLSMLFNDSRNNPGRYNLKKIVQDQIESCNAELCLRWCENKYKLNPDDEDIEVYSRFKLDQDLYNLLTKPEYKDKLPRDKWKEIPLKSCLSNFPSEFEDISVKTIMEGCEGLLGSFSRKHITLTFLLKIGIELNSAEMKEFNVPNKKVLDVVKEKLKLPTYYKLHKSDKGLTLKELESLIHLREAKYSTMSNDLLILLKNKILPRLIREIDFQISQWEDMIKKLEYVANTKYNFSLLPDNTESAD